MNTTPTTYSLAKEITPESDQASGYLAKPAGHMESRLACWIVPLVCNSQNPKSGKPQVKMSRVQMLNCREMKWEGGLK